MCTFTRRDKGHIDFICEAEKRQYGMLNKHNQDVHFFPYLVHIECKYDR